MGHGYKKVGTTDLKDLKIIIIKKRKILDVVYMQRRVLE